MAKLIVMLPKPHNLAIFGHNEVFEPYTEDVALLAQMR
jgi:hypothetical protein